MTYQRPQAATLPAASPSRGDSSRWWPGRARSARRTLVQQVVEACGLPYRYRERRRADAARRRVDRAAVGGGAAARAGRGQAGAVLVLDEIQKIPGWSETVKRLWDEDTRARVPLKVVLLGSAPLLDRARADREPRRPVRGAAPAALVVRRDARGVRLVARPVPLLRRLSRRGAAHRRAAALGALRPRLADRDHDLARRAAAHARRQAGAAAPAVRARLPLLRAGALVHQDARASCRTPATRRRSRTTSTCSPAPAW